MNVEIFIPYAPARQPKCQRCVEPACAYPAVRDGYCRHCWWRRYGPMFEIWDGRQPPKEAKDGKTLNH